MDILGSIVLHVNFKKQLQLEYFNFIFCFFKLIYNFGGPDKINLQILFYQLIFQSMKKLLYVFVCLFLINVQAKAQDPAPVEDSKFAVTVGFLNGGGSLIGADFEIMAGDRVGLQVGAGLVGLGAGINYHLKPGIRSSMLSLQYWHQGVGDSYTQSLIGPSYVFRAKKLLTAQIGFGFALEEGPNWPEDKEQPPAMLMYSIGIYLPVK